jgi:hypothetical protein
MGGIDRRSFLAGLAGGTALSGGAGLMIVQSMPYPAVGSAVDAPTAFSVPGAWIWLPDPRAIAVGDGIVTGAITTAGDLIAYELGDGTPVDLRGSTFQVDDHANPAFLVRSSDNRILAFASAHNGNGLYTYLSTNPNDASAFGSETDIDTDLGRSEYSYPNPIQLTGETNDPIYLFFRAKGATANRHVYYSTSTDQGATWSAATLLIGNNSDSSDHSPYVKIVQNGNDRIDFFCTDGHPQFTATNSIYHFYYQGGSFRETDGTPLSLGIAPATDLTKVYDGTTNRAWIWDATIDGSGNPVCVYAVFNSTTDHRYRRAKWNGSSWDDGEICTAGSNLYGDQAYYSGGVAIDPDDIDTVFASREVTGIHQLFRYTYSGSWSGTQITADERAIRPYVVRDAAEPRLLYMSGDYMTYTDFETSVKLMDSTASAATGATDTHRANVILHVRGDDTVDYSPVGRTLTYGSGIGRNGAETGMPGTSDSGGSGVITAPDANDWAFSGDFTIEMFGLDIDAPTALNTLISHWRAASGGRSWQCAYRGDQSPDTLGIFLSTDGTASTFIGGAWTPSGVHDLCFERSGTTVRVYVDGTMLTSGTFSGALRNGPGRMVIGRSEGSGGNFAADACLDGRWREIRITAGVARYANSSGYSVPSRPLPTS